MKLLLTSEGISNKFIEKIFLQFIKKIENKKVCIAYSVKNCGDEKFVKFTEKELEKLGLQYDSINISEELNFENFPSYGIYYICGGNTYYILDRMKKTKLFDVIKNKKNENNCVYVGVSAGSIIAGGNIKIASLEPLGDDNDVNLQDYSGLDFLDFHVYPHYEKSVKKYIENFSKSNSSDVIALTDDGAIALSEGSDISAIKFVNKKEVFCFRNK